MSYLIWPPDYYDYVGQLLHQVTFKQKEPSSGKIKLECIQPIFNAHSNLICKKMAISFYTLRIPFVPPLNYAPHFILGTLSVLLVVLCQYDQVSSQENLHSLQT